MPELARKYNQQYSNRETYPYGQTHARTEFPKRPETRTVQRTVPIRRTADNRKIERNNFIHRMISVSLVTILGLTILPNAFNKVTKQMFNPTPNAEITANFHDLRFPTSNYLANHWALGERSLRGAEVKKPQMTFMNETNRMTGLENQIENLMTMYPTIHPSVFVWDFENGNFVDVNADESFATASIIKLPILVQLFRSIEKNQMTIYDEMALTEYYRTEGSGSMQFKAANSTYTIDKLARMMITESDNSATNMIMAKLGSMTDVNQGIREWGLKNTNVQTWLPDLAGTNRTTARDMATILYNIDNPNFLSVSSRERIFDYMGHVENNRLIKAGLGQGATFLHKTGDIGKMLGDAGIVYTPNNKKYIVVILANRPHNSPSGKEFIVKASEIIYNNMVR